MAEGDGAGTNMIWAVTLIIIVAIIAGAVYYSGVLNGNSKKEVDINIETPKVKTN